MGVFWSKNAFFQFKIQHLEFEIIFLKIAVDNDQ
jgi:hypothetical protein